MNVLAEPVGVIQKTQDLCQSLLELPNFNELRTKVDAFMADEMAKYSYQMLTERSQMLQEKQSAGAPITDEEIAQYEALRDTFMKNTVATSFIEAQKEIQALQETVNQYFSKTFEIGRVPQAADFESCGSGCGCH